MDRNPSSLDDLTLAAFIADSLPQKRRQEVSVMLSHDERAREVLDLAYQALEAADTPEDPAPPEGHAPSTPNEHTPMAPVPSASPKPTPLQRVAQYAAITAVLFTVGLTLRLAFGPPSTVLRTDAGSGLPLSVEVTTDDLQFSWTSIPNAYSYRIVIWDPQEARVVAQYATADNTLDTSNDFIAQLRPQLLAAHNYKLRIDAIDPQNRVIESSEMINFSLKE